MAVESEEILSKISNLIESKVDELTTNLNNFRQEASNNNQTLENAIGSIKSVIDEKLSKIDQISSEINSIQTSVQSVSDNVSATNNKIDNILSQQNQLQRTVDSVSQNIEKLSTVTSNQLTYLSNQSQNITEKIDKLSLQQERESRTAAVEGARGTVVVDPATGKTVSGVAAADATGAGEETKQSLIGSVLSGIKGILTSPLALGAALGTAALGTAYALRKEPPETPQAGSDAELNIPPPATSGGGRTSGQTGQPLTGRVMTGGATAPKNLSEDTLKALNEVARENNLDPSAISMMIDTESKWKTSTRSPSGTYRGLTQIGRQTFKEAGGRLGGLTWQQYQNASPADQIRVYGSWLKHYKFQDKLKRNDVNLSELPPNLQAAYLQGFQFAPNAESWQRQFGKGNYGVRTTRTRQARALGSTSINDMARYYGQKAKRYPPVFEKRESGVEQRPQPDASREQTQSQQSQQTDARREDGQQIISPNVGRVVQKQMEVAGIRKRPISNKLEKVLRYASQQSGAEVVIFSGGQRGKHEPGHGKRIGSTRHDYGNAADLDLFVTEGGKRRRLNTRNKQDRQIMQKFIFAAAQAGATGIGHGSGYMGSGRLHVGFGKVATWGGGMESTGFNSAFYEGRKNQIDLNKINLNAPTEEQQSNLQAEEKRKQQEQSDDKPSTMTERERAASEGRLNFATGEIEGKTESFLENKKQFVPGIIVTSPTPDRRNLDASDVVPPEKPVREFKGSENSRRQVLGYNNKERKIGRSLLTPEQQEEYDKLPVLRGPNQKFRNAYLDAKLTKDWLTTYVPGKIVDRRNLGASGVVLPEKTDEDYYKQFEGSIATAYDLDGEKVNLKPSQTINNMKQLDELLKMIKEKQAQQAQQEKQAQQAQPQRHPVAGQMAGDDFYDPTTLKKTEDENTKGDNTGVRSAPPPPHKKLDLNEIYT